MSFTFQVVKSSLSNSQEASLIFSSANTSVLISSLFREVVVRPPYLGITILKLERRALKGRKIQYLEGFKQTSP
ncbi:hypothetical protein Y032_0204g1884 [Ancylostoma ceylanicum]|nr:hypothetical protein Y032_0204g1884 [Ancylostoma ceylanicum]